MALNGRSAARRAGGAGEAVDPPAPGRALPLINLALFLAGLATIVAVLNFFALRPWLRLRVDATRTRAYSLSEQTRRLLEGLEGDWTVAMILSRQGAGADQLRQVREILDRFREASDRITTVQIDPADPSALDRYEALLARLRAIDRDRTAAYDEALASARAVTGEYEVFTRRQAGALTGLRQRLGKEHPALAPAEGTLGPLGLRGEQAQRVLQEEARARRVDEGRPLPDYDAARSIMAAALSGWAEELHRIAGALAGWRGDAGADPALRQLASATQESHRELAVRLAAAADTLKRLEPLATARIGRSLEQGEAAVVIGPRGAAVIPSAQIFPPLNLRRRDSGDVAYDQRFRGEQAIAAALRTLLVEHMPMVVFVHAQDESMLRRRPQNVDLAGAAGLLEASRYELREWPVGRGDRPVPAPGQDGVWIVVPPPVVERRSAPGERELALLDAVAMLIGDGEPVLLNLTPGVPARSGPNDPWRRLAAMLGVEADTGRVIFERVRDQEGRAINQRTLEIVDYARGHPVAAAAHGLRTTFDLPVALRPASGEAGGSRAVIAEIEPAANRWLEDDWMINPDRLDAPRDAQRFAESLPVVLSLERPHPLEPGRKQRCVVVGSGGWLLSYLADLAVPGAGERPVLLNPGNYELLLAATAWLAGADDLIAPSPVSQQVARLDGITPAARTVWRWVAVAVIPGSCLAMGVAVWLARRR